MSSAGAEAVDLAESAGLVLDPWQRWVLEGSLGERFDGKWSAFEVGLWVSRQNGKGSILEARELAGLVLFDERLIIHSAHEFKTATEHFRRMQALVESCEDLRRKVLKVYTANGKEAIHFRNGARLLFIARTGGSGRGFTGDCIVFDEAYKLPPSVIGAMMPTLSTVPNPQIWYTSSAAKPDSETMHAMNRRARSDDPGRLWLADWGCEPGTLLDDRDAWYRANPGLGIRITEDFVSDEMRAMQEIPNEFARERLGIHDGEDLLSGVFEAGVWAGCGDEKSQPGDKLALAFDVAEGMSWASFAVASRRADGLVHVELVERQAGTAWVLDAAKELTAKWGLQVVLDPKSPAASFLTMFADAGVGVVELPAGDMPKACATFQRMVVDGELRHLSQPPLDAAVASAAIRTAGDSWVWSRSASNVEITALVAATVAVWHVAQPDGSSVVELFI